MIGDLTGAGRVVEALTTAVGKSLGYIFEPWQIRRIGRARTEVEAERILAVAAAKEEVAARTRERRGSKSVAPRDVAAGEDTPDAALMSPLQRTSFRLRTAELRRTDNIEGIVSLAADHVRMLASQREIRSDEIQQDWMDQFLKLAENVSDMRIAEIWAGILARQIVKDERKTSLATLDILRLLEPHQASQFRRCIAFTCSFGLCFDVWDQRDPSIVMNTNDSDVLALEEIGFLRRTWKNSHTIMFRDFVLGFFFGPSAAALPPKNWMPKILEFDFVQPSWRGTELASILVPRYLEIVNGDHPPGSDAGGKFVGAPVRRAIVREWAVRMSNRCDFVAIGASLPVMHDVTSGVETVFTHVFSGKRWRALPPDAVAAQIGEHGANREVIVARLEAVRRLVEGDDTRSRPTRASAPGDLSQNRAPRRTKMS